MARKREWKSTMYRPKDRGHVDKWRRRIEARVVELMQIHGPDGTELKFDWLFDFGFRPGVAAMFPGRLWQGVRWREPRRFSHPERDAWEIVTRLLSWLSNRKHPRYVGADDKIEIFDRQAAARVKRNPRSRGRRPGRRHKLLLQRKRAKTCGFQPSTRVA